MFTPAGVLLIGIGFLIACLITIYLFAIRINSRTVNSISENNNLSIEDLNDEIKNSSSSKSKSLKKNRKQSKARETQSHALQLENNTLDSHASTEVFSSSNEEEDLIALATLKGYDTSAIRRRNIPSPNGNMFVPSPGTNMKNLSNDTPNTYQRTGISLAPVIIDSIVSIESNNTSTSTVTESNFVKLIEREEVFVISHFEPDNTNNVEKEDWSHIPTREEEISKSLKNKILALENELEESKRNSFQISRSLEISQKRIFLLEQDLKEQRKINTSAKVAMDAQMMALRAANQDMSNKLSTMESDALNASFFKNELDRAKEIIAHLQKDCQSAQDENREIARQFSEMKTENDFLRDQAYFADSLSNKCMKLEKDLEESRKELAVQIETAQTELKNTRAKLESEVAFHRAEHANSVGSSTALHQEISQLKNEITDLNSLVSAQQSRIEELENINSDLLTKLEGSNNVTSELDEVKCLLSDAENRFERSMGEKMSLQHDLDELKQQFETVSLNLEASKSEISVLNSEIESLKSEIAAKETESKAMASNASEAVDITEVDTLRKQLAEAEAKISGLQSDLTREIKRADVSKKVYEAKLALLEKDNN